MKVLDCESAESTYRSLETILGLKKCDLSQLFELIKVYDAMRPSYGDFLLSSILAKTDCDTSLIRPVGFTPHALGEVISIMRGYCQQEIPYQKFWNGWDATDLKH